jgi:hypothetical protein
MGAPAAQGKRRGAAGELGLALDSASGDTTGSAPPAPCAETQKGSMQKLQITVIKTRNFMKNILFFFPS